MPLKQRELHINCLRGLNEVLFGMSPDDMIVKLGKAEEVTTATAIYDKNAISKRTEIRNKEKFFYEDNILVCISGDLSSPFYLESNRIPAAFFEALQFLKSKSKLNFRFTNNTSYIFVDLGLVLYPYEIVDIEAGVPTTTKKFRLSVCNMGVIKRYTQHFLNLQEKTNEDQGDYILSKLTEFAESY